MAIIFATTVCASCTGALYNVAPVPKSSSPEAVRAANESLEITAEPIDEQRSFRDFDANLQLARVIAVDVTITNRSQNSAPADFVLKNNERSWKPISPKSALSRVMKYYGVSFYGKESYRKTVEAYEGVGLPTTDLSPGEERRGILFFDVRKAKQFDNLVLEVKGSGQPVVITLN